MNKPVVVIPNLNGGDELLKAVNSLLNQTFTCHIIVIDNASVDNSVGLLRSKYPEVELIQNVRNLGYTGGVNIGFKRAIKLEAAYVAPFNNDAVADKHWLERLVDYLDVHPKTGAAAPKVLNKKGDELDSSGDCYTVWGLPFPRGRGEKGITKYDSETTIFAASGAACCYRITSLQEVGLLDESFFAYYEDVDLSFRLQLAGWHVALVPEAIVYHNTGMTSSRIKGFTTYQTMKNLPLLWYKNVPAKYLLSVGFRLLLVQSLFFARALSRGHGWLALKGSVKGLYLLVAKNKERGQIQRTRKVSDEYIWSMLVHDLPPNARVLRKLRTSWWKLTGHKETV